jgi:DNA topoisomerase-1
VRAIDEVARRLGNTRAVCRKSYVHPAVIDAFLAGSMVRVLGTRAAADAAILRLLRRPARS